MAYPANTTIWLTYGNFTGQKVILYEGAQSGWGRQHVQYRQNWNNKASAQDCVEYTVADAQAVGQDKYGYPVYDHCRKTTVLFENWTILVEIIVNNGHATDPVNSNGNGLGAIPFTVIMQPKHGMENWAPVLSPGGLM
jgi:hypothetical protein